MDTNRKPHVLILSSEEFLPPENHLSGIFQLHQASALANAGFRVGVISIRQALSVLMIVRAGLYRLARARPGNALDDRPLAELAGLLYRKLLRPDAFVISDSVDGIPVIRAEGFYFLPPSPKTNYIGWVRAGMAGFEEYTRRYGRPDIVHAHNLDSAGLLAHRIAQKFGVPFVVTEHSTFFARGLVPESLLPKLRRAAEAARSLAVVSPALGNTLEQQLGVDAAHIEWIPNVIDPEIIAAPLTLHEQNGGGFGFLSIGNLIPVKDHATLLRAFARAFAGKTDVSLRIGGDGPLESDLKELVEQLGIASQVAFLGRLTREQVIDEFDACDAFVLPSTVETFGVVLIEALVRGKPVIATRCGGPETFIEETDGILVAAADVDELAKALAAMRTGSARYDARQLREHALRRFGPATLIQRLERLYGNALSTNA